MSSRLNSPRTNDDVSIEDMERPVKVFSFCPFLSFTNWLVGRLSFTFLFLLSNMAYFQFYGRLHQYMRIILCLFQLFSNSSSILQNFWIGFPINSTTSQTLSESIESKSKFQATLPAAASTRASDAEFQNAFLMVHFNCIYVGTFLLVLFAISHYMI